MLRAHTFFKLVQTEWIARINKNYKQLEVSAENESNLTNGGDCSIFELLDALRTALPNEPSQERILSTLRPDILQTKVQNKQSLELEFQILKITNKIAKSGKSMETIFHMLMEVNSETCKSMRQVLPFSPNRQNIRWLPAGTRRLLHAGGPGGSEEIH